MPYVDYREWYRQEQARRQQAGLGPVGSPQGFKQPGPYKPSTLEQAGATAAGILGIPGVPQAIGQYASSGSAAAATTAGATAPASTAPSGFMGLTNGAGGLTSLGYGAAGLGTVAGGYGLYDALKNDRGVGASAGSGAAMGAGIGTMIAPGIGTAIGALIGGAGGAGLGAAFGIAPRTQKEEKRWKKLQEAGFDIPEWVKKGEDIKDPNAHYRADLAADHVGQTDQGWNNNLFAKSRNEADLRPEDIWGYADNTENFGRNWMGSSEDARRQVMQLALDNKIVDENKGTVDINWTPELLQQAQTILGDAVAQNPENKGRRMWVPPSNPWRPPTG